MNHSFFYFLTLLAGAALAVQAGMNSQLRMAVGNPIISAVLSFSVGLTGLLVYLSISRPTDFPTLATFSQIAWWKWLGGLLGAFYIVVTVLSAPRIGAASFTGLLIAGQLVTALLLDYFGWVGFEAKPIQWTKIVGATCLLLGVYLMTRK
jgi:bacterial/archaeal transporter family-2 protein